MPIRFDPLRELDRMAQSLGQLLNRPGPIRVSRGDDEVRLEIDLPGVKADDIELTVDADRVVVRAVRRSSPAGVDEGRDTELQREFGFTDPIDLDRVSADYEDGVLSVRLPGASGSRARRVPVRSGSDRPSPDGPPSPSSAPTPPGASSPPIAPDSGDETSGTAPETAPTPLGEQANPLPTS